VLTTATFRPLLIAAVLDWSAVQVTSMRGTPATLNSVLVGDRTPD
jgi:hypothetical protein